MTTNKKTTEKVAEVKEEMKEKEYTVIQDFYDSEQNRLFQKKNADYKKGDATPERIKLLVSKGFIKEK